MKHIKLLSAIIFSICLFSACSSGSPKTTAKESLSNTGDSTYTGNSSFAYTINGRHVAIKDFMHNGDGKNWMALFLNEVKNNAVTGMVKLNVTNELTHEVFNFSIGNTGTTHILHYRPSLSNFANNKSNTADYMSPKYKNYYGDSVSVTITSVDAKHVTGTFSGKFISEDEKPISLEITDGSFDVLLTQDNSK